MLIKFGELINTNNILFAPFFMYFNFINNLLMISVLCPIEKARLLTSTFDEGSTLYQMWGIIRRKQWSRSDVISSSIVGGSPRKLGFEVLVCFCFFLPICAESGSCFVAGDLRERLMVGRLILILQVACNFHTLSRLIQFFQESCWWQNSYLVEMSDDVTRNTIYLKAT